MIDFVTNRVHTAVHAALDKKAFDLDVLDGDNAQLYWTRDEAYDTVIRFNDSKAVLPAFCRVLERWIAHFFDVAATIQAVPSITEQKWVWHIGLDAEA